MGRVALVTGGSRGIGAAVSRLLSQQGYAVAANYAGNEEAASAFEKETGIRTYKWSVADYEQCAEGVAAVEQELGPVEILVNNAGITRDAMFHRMKPEAWRQVIDTNLTGAYNMTHQVWAGMRERSFGRVINISSVNGQKGQMGQTNYSASKAGEIGFTKALAQEGAPRASRSTPSAPDISPPTWSWRWPRMFGKPSSSRFGRPSRRTRRNRTLRRLPGFR